MNSAFSRSSLEQLLHARPQRLLADEVDRARASSASPTSSVLAQILGAASSASSRRAGDRRAASARSASPAARAACRGCGSARRRRRPRRPRAAPRSIAGGELGRRRPCGCRRRPRASRPATPGKLLDRVGDRHASREPGTSKPPPVRFSVCRAANGSETSRRTIQTPRTSLRRRRTKPRSRSMAACMCACNHRRGRGISPGRRTCNPGRARIETARWSRTIAVRAAAARGARRPDLGRHRGPPHALPVRAPRARSCSRPATATPRARSRSTPCPRTSSQYLGEHGYDVWLLDYRASPDLPSSFTQFTVDDIAMRDWPAAIDHVRARDRRRLGPGDGPLRRRPVAVHGHRRRPGGPALGDVLGARRPPDPHARQPGCAPACGWPTLFKHARHQGPQHRLRPEVAAGRRRSSA